MLYVFAVDRGEAEDHTSDDTVDYDNNTTG